MNRTFSISAPQIHEEENTVFGFSPGPHGEEIAVRRESGLHCENCSGVIICDDMLLLAILYHIAEPLFAEFSVEIKFDRSNEYVSQFLFCEFPVGKDSVEARQEQ